MAKVTLNIAGYIGCHQYGVELDIPDDVKAKGPDAILKWCNKNISYVDAQTMKVRQETTYLKEVIEVSSVE